MATRKAAAESAADETKTDTSPELAADSAVQADGTSSTPEATLPAEGQPADVQAAESAAPVESAPVDAASQAPTEQADPAPAVLQPSPAEVAQAQADGVGEQDEFVSPFQREMQERADEINRKGYIGSEADPTDDRAYTIEGVVSGVPTPENPLGLTNESQGGAS